MQYLHLALPAIFISGVALAQGTFQYDQRSWPVPIPANVLWTIQHNEPIGQSFVPSLSTVGFVQLELFDSNPNNGLGATIYINLRSNSISGPIIASSSPLFLPETPIGGGVTNFLFSGQPTVSSGATYVFELVVQSGDALDVNTLGANDYPQGNGYFQGGAQPLNDLWFREGIIVPEPSAAIVLSVSVAAFLFIRYRK